MIIRPAIRADAAAIAAMKNHIIRDTVVTFNSVETTPQAVADAIDNTPYFVAADAQDIIGYCSYGRFRPGVGYARTVEHSIAVTPATQSKGVGRALMAALMAHAKAADLTTMIACISADNAQGRAFHAKLGFDETGYLPGVGHKFGRDLDLVFAQTRL